MQALKRILLLTMIVVLLLGATAVSAFAASDWIVNWSGTVSSESESGDVINITLAGYVDPAFSYDGFTGNYDGNLTWAFPNQLAADGTRAVPTVEYAFVILNFDQMFQELGATTGSLRIKQSNPAFTVSEMDFGAGETGGVKEATYAYDPDDPEFFVCVRKGDTVTLEVANADDSSQQLTFKIKGNFSMVKSTGTTGSSGGGNIGGYVNPSVDSSPRTEATLAPAGGGSVSDSGSGSGDAPVGSLNNPASYTGESGGGLSISSNVAPWLFLEGSLAGPTGYASPNLTLGEGMSVVEGKLVVTDELLATLPKGEYTLRITYANHILSYYFVVE